MTKKNMAFRRLTAGVGALALTAAGVLALAAPAHAAVGPDQPDAPTTGSLTINKYDGGGGSADGSVDGREPLEGVEFTATRVGLDEGAGCAPLDLAVAADWDGIEDLYASAPAAPAAPFCLTGTSVVETTNEDGQAVFADIPVGVYYVVETDPGANAIVSPVVPFYVSIPRPDASGWDYNPIVNPKNAVLETPSKTIDADQGELVVGSDVTWTITAPIPTLNEEETAFDSAVITDTLDSRLQYVAGSSSVFAGAIELVEGTHFTVSGNAVWTFTPAGLQVLFENQGSDLTVEFDSTVLSVGDGSIPNDVYTSSFNGTTVPGEVVPYTYWGQLSILKVDDSTPVRTLEGAEFQVFLPNASDVCEAEAPATGSLATGTSDANGVVQWAGVAAPTNVLGLWIANSPDGELDTPSKTYCVYETVVPAGHSADPAGKLVSITPGAPVEGESALTVVNLKKDGPDLPLTGSTGAMAMSVIGLLLVAGGATAVIVARRRRNASV